MNTRLEFRKFFEGVDASSVGGGVIAQEVPQLGGIDNAEWLKSQSAGKRGPVRSKYVAEMKKKMKKQ